MAGSSSTTRIRSRGMVGTLDGRRGQRQGNGYPPASAAAVLGPRRPPVLLQDPLHDRQPQAGAAAAPGEEWFEDPGQVLGAEPGAFVLDRGPQHRPGRVLFE